jgi:hypothetical protein
MNILEITLPLIGAAAKTVRESLARLGAIALHIGERQNYICTVFQQPKEWKEWYGPTLTQLC